MVSFFCPYHSSIESKNDSRDFKNGFLFASLLTFVIVCWLLSEISFYNITSVLSSHLTAQNSCNICTNRQLQRLATTSFISGSTGSWIKWNYLWNVEIVQDTGSKDCRPLAALFASPGSYFISFSAFLMETRPTCPPEYLNSPCKRFVKWFIWPSSGKLVAIPLKLKGNVGLND